MTDDILSCDEFRWFWVSWRGEYIEVGRGHVVGTDRFMMLRDEGMLSIHALTIASGTEADGRFELSTYDGEFRHFPYSWRLSGE